MNISMPPGKSLPQILLPSIFFSKITPTPRPHTQTSEKGEGTIKVYLNRDTILLQGSLKTVKRLFTKL